MAGPERPPDVLPKTGRLLSMSMAIPVMVLITDKASLPASMHFLALSFISAWLGESFVMIGLDVTDLVRSRGLGDVYKRQLTGLNNLCRHFRIISKLHATFFYIRTRYI